MWDYLFTDNHYNRFFFYSILFLLSLYSIMATLVWLSKLRFNCVLVNDEFDSCIFMTWNNGSDSLSDMTAAFQMTAEDRLLSNNDNLFSIQWEM